ncbi:MAG: DUF6261 family protein [Chitinispirillales bacterium]|jgi:hypothetical protein|nr:DUF6261 family protein [Chitinispirillales bacterium]
MSNAESNSIQIIQMHQLRNEEHFTLHSEIAALLGGASAGALRAADAALAGLTPYVAKLEQRNNAFKALLNTRNEETAAATGSAHIAVKDARSAIDKIYARIRLRVNSYVDDETPNPAIDAFVAQLNVIVKRFNTLAAHHHHKKGVDGDAS